MCSMATGRRSIYWPAMLSSGNHSMGELDVYRQHMNGDGSGLVAKLERTNIFSQYYVVVCMT